MDISEVALVHLGTLSPTPEKPVFDEVYVLNNYEGGDPNFSREEFSEGGWMSPAELLKMLAVKSSKASLPAALELLLASK